MAPICAFSGLSFLQEASCHIHPELEFCWLHASEGQEERELRVQRLLRDKKKSEWHGWEAHEGKDMHNVSKM